MKRKNSRSKSVDSNIVKGLISGAVAVLIILFAINAFGEGGSLENVLLVFAKKGGGGKTGGDSGSSNFYFPEDASDVLLNTSFETNVDDVDLVPDGWTYHYDQPNRNTGVDCTVSKTGNCSYYVSGKKNSAIKQYVRRHGEAGDMVTVSGWGKGLNVADRKGRRSRGGVYWVQVWIHYEDGTNQFDVLKKFPNGTYDFMHAEASFEARKPFHGMTVFARFDGSGEAWFDDISLTVTPAN